MFELDKFYARYFEKVKRIAWRLDCETYNEVVDLINQRDELLEALSSARFVIQNRANKDLPEWEAFAAAAENEIRAAITKAKEADNG